MSRSFSTLALVLFGILTGSSVIFAHAFPDHAEPRVGATLTGPPQEVKIWFTEELEPAFSTLRVLNDTGTIVDTGDSKVTEEDHHLLQVDLLPLPQGIYTVEWNVLSVDSHRTEGRFTFTVR